MSKALKKLIDINGLREFKNKIVGTDSAYVHTTDVDQTIAGTKTFSKPIVGSVTGNAATATKATQDAVGNTITTTYATKAENNTKANDSDVVHKSGNETIAGTKTFSSQIKGNISGSSTSCTGNSASATKLATARTISLTGAVIGSTAFNGSANASINTTLSNIDASKITSGTIDLARIPKAAIPELKIVANDTARFALTTSDIQNGDTVQVTSTGKMYYVKDQTKLSSEAGYAVYTAGTASSVPWSGVTGKPSSYTPAAHTQAASTITGLATVATSGSYTDLANKPEIPTVNNATLTIQKNGTTVKTFTANASANVTANITVPTKVSELTNDSGYITGVSWNSVSGKPSTFTPSSHTHDDRYYTENEVNNLLNGKANTSGTYSNLTVGNAGSATNATYANWLRTSSHSDHLFHTEWDNAGYFWTYVTTGNGDYRAVRVARSDKSGNADTATKATQDSDGNKITTTYSKNGHTHDDRYYTEAEVNNLLAGKANSSHTHPYIPTSASCNKNWNWSGRAGQPSWLWGSEDGTNMYVYNPSDFRVNYANSANSAITAANGVDSNGSNWIRFRNGIQICWDAIRCGTSGSSRWTYGASFSSTPVVTVCDQGSNNNIIYLTRAANIGTVSCLIVMLDENRGSYAPGIAQCMAIGSWK